MYGFAILAFGGLVTMLAMRLIVSGAKREMSKTGTYALTAALGVGFAYLVDYSLFAAWGFTVRSAEIGTIVTGLMMAGFAGLWEEFVGFVRHYHRHGDGETHSLRRAA